MVHPSSMHPATGTWLRARSKVTDALVVADAVGGNLQDVMREEELAAAAARAAQPAVTDVKTAAPGAARASGWARVTAGSTPTKGTPCLGLRLDSCQYSFVSVSAMLFRLAAEALFLVSVCHIRQKVEAPLYPTCCF